MTELTELSALAERQMQLEGDVDRIKEQLATVTEQLRVVSEQLIPDLMDAAGLEKVVLANGYTVSVSTDLTASVPRDRMYAVTATLEDAGAGDLITSEVTATIKRGVDNDRIIAVMAAIEQAGFAPIRKKGVNTATLKAWLRRQLADNVAVDLDLFGAHVIRKTKIKQ